MRGRAGVVGLVTVVACALPSACGRAHLPAQSGPSVTTSIRIVAAPGNSQRPEVFAAMEGGHLVFVRWPRRSPGAVAGTLGVNDEGKAPQQVPFLADAFPRVGSETVLSDTSGSRLGSAGLSADGAVLSLRLVDPSTLRAVDRPVLRLQAVTEGEFDQLNHGLLPVRLR